MRAIPFNLRVNEEEKAIFVEAARRSGKSLSLWVRETLLEEARLTEQDVEEDKAVVQDEPIKSIPVDANRSIPEGMVICGCCGKMASAARERCQHCTAKLV